MGYKTREYWQGWLGGLADGAAHVGKKEIVLSSTHEKLLSIYQNVLADLGIYSSFLGPYKHTKMPHAKPMYRLRIQRREDLRLFNELVGFKDTSKQTKLDAILTS